MSPVSLLTLGRTVLGIGPSDPVSLSSLYTNPYTRTVPPLRINPFSIANGNGPSSFSPPYSLLDWLNYNHTVMNIGSDVTATIGYGGRFTVGWAGAAGFQSDVCRYRVSVRDAGTTPDTSVDPLVSPTAVQYTTSLSELFVGMTVGNFYTMCVQAEFNDGSTVRLSNGFPGSITETELDPGVTEGIITSIRLPASAPTINLVTQTPLSGGCEDPVADGLVLHVSMDMFGPSLGTIQMQINSGGWVTQTSALPAGTSNYSISAVAGGFGNGDTVEFRVSYNDVSGPVWSNTGSILVLCGPI